MARAIERSAAFKRDFKREMKGRHKQTLATLLGRILDALANDLPLHPSLADHSLGGNWAGYRECHIKPDLLLIYRKTPEGTLRLARLGSHSELFQ